MKRIELKGIMVLNSETIRHDDGIYSIYLGNGHKQSFHSQRNAKQFLSETNRFLNQKLYELNFLYIDTFTEYRKAWVYFSSHKSNSKIAFMDLENKCRRLMQDIDRAFELMVNRSSWTNGNYQVFTNFRHIVASQYDLLNQLINLYTSKSDGLQKYQVMHVIKQLETLELEVKKYPNKINLD